MTFFLTLVASAKPLTASHFEEAALYLREKDIQVKAIPSWLDPDKAGDLALETPLLPAHIRALRARMSADKIDIFITSGAGRRKKLLIADMDSTIVQGEMLDELAAYAGLGDKIAGITARAMAGELDFGQALRERVAMLKGLSADAVIKTLTKAKLSPGAETLVRTMTAHGALCVLVSGGFTVFTSTIAQRAGFQLHHGNTLFISDGVLTGRVGEPILDKEAKLSFLHSYAANLGIAPAAVLALGDGANDLPMLQAAGAGIGYHPKPLLREALDNCILYGDLSAALFAQGYRREEFSA